MPRAARLFFCCFLWSNFRANDMACIIVELLHKSFKIRSVDWPPKALFTRTLGSIHPGSALTASLKKIAVYTSPGQLCGVVKSQPGVALCVSCISWHVASCLFNCLLFSWLFLLFKWPRVGYSKRLHEPGLSWPAFTRKNFTKSQPVSTGQPYLREGLPA